jgi:hypothetical protein
MPKDLDYFSDPIQSTAQECAEWAAKQAKAAVAQVDKARQVNSRDNWDA